MLTPEEVKAELKALVRAFQRTRSIVRETGTGMDEVTKFLQPWLFSQEVEVLMWKWSRLAAPSHLDLMNALHYVRLRDDGSVQMVYSYGCAERRRPDYMEDPLLVVGKSSSDFWHEE